MSTKREYEELIEEIRAHDRRYFVEARPTISDHAYDLLVKKLEQIEKEHPDWVTATSPTQRVGKAITGGFKQVAHTSPMLSLDNTYSKEEIEDWIKRVHKLLHHREVVFCAELKMDGIAVSLRYEKGNYVRGLTRGDGKKGEDVTANIKAIRSVPLELHGHHVPDLLEVRGEVYMPRKEFLRQNAAMQASGEEPWANPRNAAAGSLKLLDPKEAATRGLAAVFYGIAEHSSPDIQSQYACHELLHKLGLPIFAEERRKKCHDVDAIMRFADHIEKERHKLPFDIDGIVIKVDDLRSWEDLGTTGKSPRWAIAYKFAPEQATTRIEDITVQVGRTGVLTPVAELKPVFLAGSTIARATLHNQEEVARKDIRIGDFVVIEKAGDVIPQVVHVDLKKRPKESHPWKMPKRCPSCDTSVVAVEGEVAVRCPNKKCQEQIIRRIAYFAGKDAMDIEHLGERVVEQLVKADLVKSISDLYTLTEKELASLEGFKEKSIHNLLESIKKSRHVSLARFLLSLGIKYVGEGTAEDLAESAGSIDALAKMSEEELKEIEGVGDKVAHAVVQFFADPEQLKEIHRLYHLGVTPERPKPKRTDHLFSKKTFVITGTLSSMTRDEATECIKSRGGHVSGSVSRKTDYLVVGEDAGSKLDKAKELGVKMLTEKQFKDLL